jgi:hypothetical protein
MEDSLLEIVIGQIVVAAGCFNIAQDTVDAADHARNFVLLCLFERLQC